MEDVRGITIRFPKELHAQVFGTAPLTPEYQR